MNVLAINLKNWCIDNISPLAWSRIVLKALPQLRDIGFSLDEIENPSDNLELDAKGLKIIEKSMNEIYAMDLPQEVVNS